VIGHNGSLFLTGSFTGEATFKTTRVINSSVSDFFLARYSPGGDPLWIFKGGADAEIRGTALALTSSGSALITGYFRGAKNSLDRKPISSRGQRDIFVSRIDKFPQTPQLEIQLIGKQVIVSWPLWVQDFRVESTTQPADPGSWREWELNGANVNHNSFTNEFPGGREFFRLRKP
jgi:hypothetical protein